MQNYDPSVPALRKQWKAEFKAYLDNYYKPTFTNADRIFKALTNVNNYGKKYIEQGFNLLRLCDISAVKSVKDRMLQHHPDALGRNAISVNDDKVICVDRYREFLQHYLDGLQPENDDDHDDNQKNRQDGDGEHHENDKPAPANERDRIVKGLEGLARESTYLRQERNRAIRNQCAKEADYTCYVCGIRLVDVYGERGREYIHVHHLDPISENKEQHDITIDRLRCLCPNCHCMVHHGKELMDVDELKRIYDNLKK